MGVGAVPAWLKKQEEVRACPKTLPDPASAVTTSCHGRPGLCGIQIHVQGADAVRCKLNFFGLIVGEEKDF